MTLTYEDAPDSLVPRDLQLFFKRLRKFFAGERISYFACGEYGEQLGRPHYHALLFGVEFPDKRARYRGSDLYTSRTLDRLWGLGACMIGAVTFESAAYVARYCVKKITGDQALEHYQGREPEFVRMSTRPGIGQAWFERYGQELEHNDSVVMRGREMKPPKYYDKKRDQVLMRLERFRRKAQASTRRARANASPERLTVRERVTRARLSLRRASL